MAGSKFNYPMGADEVPRRIKTVQRDSIEASAAVANSIKPVLSYLTGAEGQASSDKTIDKTFTSNSGAFDSPIWLNYDPLINPSVEFLVPLSGRFRITLSAWLFLDNYARDGDNATGVASRVITSPEILDSSGTTLMPPEMGFGPQLTLDVWGINNFQGIGFSTSLSIFVGGQPSGEKYTIRSRIGYYGYARDGHNAQKPMPSGSFFDFTAGAIGLSVNPI